MSKPTWLAMSLETSSKRNSKMTSGSGPTQNFWGH